MIPLHKRKTAVFAILSASTFFSYYNYKRHLYEQELFSRMNEVMRKTAAAEMQLSGVFIQQRQAFGWMWYFQWLMPYHQSLKFVDLKTHQTYRHVGLGHNQGEGFLSSSFQSHCSKQYSTLNRFETSIPIECWVDFKRKMGYWPSNVDVQMLENITMTPEEFKARPVERPVYKTAFGSLMKLPNGEWTISTCQSAAMYALMTEQISHKRENNSS